MSKRFKIDSSSDTDSPRRLNTPPPPTVYPNDIGTRIPHRSTSEIPSSSNIDDVYSPFFSPSNEFEKNIDQMKSGIEQIKGDPQTMKKSEEEILELFHQAQGLVAENRRIHQQFENIWNRIIFLFQTLTSSTISDLGNLQESSQTNDSDTEDGDPIFRQSNSNIQSNVVEGPMVIDELSFNIQRSNEASDYDDSSELSTGLLSTNVHRTESSIKMTSSRSEPNDPLSYSMNHQSIDQTSVGKNRKRIAIQQVLCEINVRTNEDVPALLPRINSENEIRTEEPPTNYSLIEQPTTTTTQLNQSSIDQPIRLAFEHPLKKSYSGKTDRDDEVLDLNGNIPVLTIHGNGLPAEIPVRINIVSKSSRGCFQSPYRFHTGGDRFEDSYSFTLKNSGSAMQRIEFKNLKLRRFPYNDFKNDETYILTSYPQGEKINTNIKKQHELIEEYNLKEIQLVFEYDGNFLYSNVLCETLDKCSLEIIPEHSSQQDIVSSDHNQTQMKFDIKIPGPFHCTLPSGNTYIEMALVSGARLNRRYGISLQNGEPKNPIYIKVDDTSFRLPVNIIKQEESRFEEDQDLMHWLPNIDMLEDNILPSDGDNQFHVRGRLLHSKTLPDSSSKGFYEGCQAGRTEEFIEILKSNDNN